jgi:very-short-patch-repair endonuclease
MNNDDPIQFARGQRQSGNSFETLMWQLLRNRQRMGKKFRRQHPLSPYTADFYCAEAQIVVEVDGEHHLSDNGRVHDAVRDRWMAKQGIMVLRFAGYQVERETQAVLGRIDQVLRERCAQ